MEIIYADTDLFQGYTNQDVDEMTASLKFC